MCQQKNTNSRCRGDCCKRFTLPISPEDLEADYQLYLAHKDEPTKPPPKYGEIEIIAPMVQFLELSRARPDGTLSDFERYWYSCKHLQGNGDCAIYATRPTMCVEYPYGDRCYYPGCQSEEARTGKPLPPEQGGPTPKKLKVIRP